MRRGQRLKSLPPFVNLITYRDFGGNPHFYTRNFQGLHVPIETMSVADLEAAEAWKTGFIKRREAA